jgi:CheY-like chemotaxis protein
MVDETQYTQHMQATDRPRLVLADDNALMRSTLRSLLQNEFEIVGMAADAVEAVGLVEALARYRDRHPVD